MALLPNPKVLLLDEPFEAVDPVSTRAMLNVLRRAARERGLTVLLTSHIFSVGDTMASGFFMALVVLVLFLPSSRDPLTAIPPGRLELWPLTRAERYGLRAVSPLLNPMPG